ncbi:hypothetical protein [Listeria monocytogenes]|uniref:hypothetical protein n=1 Tax=Listeria monocytogenes TaxID=1639 RepID=UPI001CD982EA|nr:hypothetical protein [Listeria monocytogenes]
MKVKRVDVMLCVSEEEADILYKEWNKEARSGDRNRLIDTGHSFIKYVNVNTIRFGDEEYQEFYLSPGVLRQGNHDEAIKLGMSLTRRSWNRFYYESKQTTNEDDYINIRIPKKGDVPIVEFKGQRYGEMPEQGLESIKLLWVTDDFTGTNLSERLSFDAVYLDKDHKPSRSSISVGESLATESNMCRVAEANSEAAMD